MLRNLSIQSKLVLMMLLVSLLSLLAASAIGYKSGRDSMTESVYQHLVTVRNSKASMVKGYLANVRNQVIVMSADETVVNAMKAFREARQELDDKSIPTEWDAALADFYKKEFVPELAKNSDSTPVLDTLLPRAPWSRHLQYQYIAKNKAHPYREFKGSELMESGDGSKYDAVHKKYHPFFKDFTERFGYEDMHLIDPRTDEILYTVQKTTEFATSLGTGFEGGKRGAEGGKTGSEGDRSGPYAHTNLGDLYRSCKHNMERDDYRFVDYQRYKPNLNNPAAFVASPIFDDNRLIGVLVLQFPINEVNKIMTGNFDWEREGLGKSGESYLVGPDATLRTRSRFHYEDPKRMLENLAARGVAPKTIERIQKAGTMILSLELRTDAVKLAQNEGKEGVLRQKDYRGEDVLTAYGPLGDRDFPWVVMAEMDTAEALAPVRKFGVLVLGTGAALALGVTLLALWLAGRFLRPIERLTEAARKVSKGEVDAQVEVTSNDEFKDLATAFNDMTRDLKAKTRQLEAKVKENEELLLNILPAPAAARLREGDGQAAQSFSDVTVMYVDIQGLDAVSESEGEGKSLDLLSDLVVAMDEAAERFGVEKVKTVGSSYLAVCGLSVARPDHVNRMMDFAQEIVRVVNRFNAERETNLVAEIGINCGPVVGGIVGRQKFIFDLWGETVTVARGLKSDGVTSIQVTPEVYLRLRDLYPFEPLGEVEVKGKGKIPTWTIKG